MNDYYVSYEVAKRLKEKGFDEKTIYHYTNCDVLQHNIVYNEYKNSEMLNAYSAPTQQMAMAWLREEREIDIIPVIRHSLKYAQESPFRDYACRVYDCDGNIVLSANKWYSKYENAVEAALEYCLTNLI